MIRIAILDDYQNAAAGLAARAGLAGQVECVAFTDHLADHAALVARLRYFEIVVTMRGRVEFTRELLGQLADLKMLVTTGHTNPAIDVAAARDLGILVCGTGGYMEATVELTWALILGMARHVPAENARLRTGGWQHTLGTDLKGATLGVVGLGNMGSRVAKIGQAFGMKVIAWSSNLTVAACEAAGVEHVTKAQLFSRSDVISIHLQLQGERNRGLIGREEFALMKPSALFVNTSRGAIVVEEDLIAALRGCRIAGAALDVFDIEPLPTDHAFRMLPNVLATPHIGYVSQNTYTIFYDDIAEDIAAYLRGTPVRQLSPA